MTQLHIPFHSTICHQAEGLASFCHQHYKPWFKPTGKKRVSARVSGKT